MCPGTISHQACPLYAAVKFSCVIVLTSGILVNIAAGPLPVCGSHVPQAAKSSANFLLVALIHALNTLLKPMMDK